jgi:hypothetical protein
VLSERLGATRFEDGRDPARPNLMAGGSSEAQILWLEQHP